MSRFPVSPTPKAVAREAARLRASGHPRGQALASARYNVRWDAYFHKAKRRRQRARERVEFKRAWNLELKAEEAMTEKPNADFLPLDATTRARLDASAESFLFYPGGDDCRGLRVVRSICFALAAVREDSDAGGILPFALLLARRSWFVREASNTPNFVLSILGCVPPSPEVASVAMPRSSVYAPRLPGVFEPFARWAPEWIQRADTWTLNPELFSPRQFAALCYAWEVFAVENAPKAAKASAKAAISRSRKTRQAQAKNPEFQAFKAREQARANINALLDGARPDRFFRKDQLAETAKAGLHAGALTAVDLARVFEDMEAAGELAQRDRWNGLATFGRPENYKMTLTPPTVLFPDPRALAKAARALPKLPCGLLVPRGDKEAGLCATAPQFHAEVRVPADWLDSTPPNGHALYLAPEKAKKLTAKAKKDTAMMFVGNTPTEPAAFVRDGESTAVAGAVVGPAPIFEFNPAHTLEVPAGALLEALERVRGCVDPKDMRRILQGVGFILDIPTNDAAPRFRVVGTDGKAAAVVEIAQEVPKGVVVPHFQGFQLRFGFLSHDVLRSLLKGLSAAEKNLPVRVGLGDATAQNPWNESERYGMPVSFEGPNFTLRDTATGVYPDVDTLRPKAGLYATRANRAELIAAIKAAMAARKEPLREGKGTRAEREAPILLSFTADAAGLGTATVCPVIWHDFGADAPSMLQCQWDDAVKARTVTSAGVVGAMALFKGSILLKALEALDSETVNLEFNPRKHGHCFDSPLFVDDFRGSWAIAMNVRLGKSTFGTP